MICGADYPALTKPPTEVTKKEISKSVLKNGLTILIKEEHAHPVVTINAAVKAGLSWEGPYIGSGISHFVEHMMFKGTRKRKIGAIEEEVKSYGGTINASTGFDSTNYYITVPKEYAAKTLTLLEDIIFHPAFDKDEVEKERDVILKEIKMNHDEPTNRVMRELWQAAYLKHPYKMPIIGYEESFRKLSRRDLVNYHSSRYTPDNTILTIVGDVDTDRMLSLARSLFKRYKRGADSVISLPREPQQKSLRIVKEYAPINLAYLAMGYHTVEFTNKDLYALDILAIILGDWDGSRFNKRLVKDEELLYTVSSFNYTPKYLGLFIIYGVGDYEKLEDAKKKILEEIERIKRDGIDGDELEAAKNTVISGYINSLETTAGLAGVMSQSELLAGDPAFFEKYVENIKAVDKKVVKEVAKNYLNENSLTFAYLYPAAERKPEKRLLSNGVRLILKEDHRLPKISLVCVFRGGLMAETEKIGGISNLTASMLLKGTKNRKEDQIKAFLERKGGELAYFSGKNTFGVTLDFLSKDRSDALDIFEDIVENSIFPEDELKKEKEKIYAAIKAEDDDIYSRGFLKLRRALFGSYPYGLRVLGEIDSVNALTQEDIKNFYKKLCVAENMVVSIVGDFQSDEIHAELEKRFADIEKSPFDIKTEKPKSISGIKKVDLSMEREQSIIFIGFLGATLESPDRYYLEILGSILSGENGRLYQSVRNKLGLAYTLDAFSQPGVETGYFALYVATEKKYLDKAKDTLFKSLNEIQEGAISQREIDLAKSSLIGRQKISLQAYKTLAYAMALDEIYDIGYDAYMHYPELITSITKDDIVKAAKRYIDLNNFVVITILGEKDVR